MKRFYKNSFVTILSSISKSTLKILSQIGLSSLLLTSTSQAQNNSQGQRFLPSLHPVGEFAELIEENISYTSSVRPEAWFELPVQTPPLGNITTLNGDVRMVSFGGGLTAGVMDGGLY